MKIFTQFSLKQYNSFGIDEKAEAFISVQTIEELKQALALEEYSSKFILGGGSNLLLTQAIKGLCIHINTKGIRVIRETDHEVTVEVEAGENWHELVLWSLAQGYGGLENLSLIPGNTGTAPIQNIGAYGVELKDVFEACSVLEISTLKEIDLSLEDMEFGYRTSLFKKKSKGQFVVTKLRLRLTKKNHKISIHYGAITKALADRVPNPKNISKAVISIRKSKLPDPEDIGNSGSFFKNPIIGVDHFKRLQSQYPLLPSYPQNDLKLKVPAGWLIEAIGYKGYRKGDAGVHEKQALVLVNYGQATGQDILDLAEEIKAKIKAEFNIVLESEVNIV